jgi:hypothetical protein
MSLAERYFKAFLAFDAAEGELVRTLLKMLNGKLIDMSRVDQYDRSVELELRDWLTDDETNAVLALGFDRLWQHVDEQEIYCTKGHRGEVNVGD